MTSITTTSTSTTPTTSVRVGLALSIILGLMNLPFLFMDIDWGTEAPPFALLLLNAVLGMVSVVCAAIAWNSGNRLAIRINAAALILNALMVVPGLFIDTTTFITVATAAIIVTTVIAVVLTMRRTPTPTTVVD